MMHDLIKRYGETNKFGQDNNWQLEVLSPGKVRYTGMLEERHLATPSAAHGGYLAGLMDAALSVAGLSRACEDGMVVTTIEFKINFLRAARKGATLLAEGQVVKYGRELIFSEATIKGDDGELIATGQGTLRKVEAEKAFRDHSSA